MIEYFSAAAFAGCTYLFYKVYQNSKEIEDNLHKEMENIESKILDELEYMEQKGYTCTPMYSDLVRTVDKIKDLDYNIFLIDKDMIADIQRTARIYKIK